MSPINKKDLLEQRGDLSQFLFHLTRSGDLKLDKDVNGIPQDRVIQIDARTSLKSMIASNLIEAKTAFGYFNFKVPIQRGVRQINQNSLVRRNWLAAVCFTETPFDHVNLQMQDILGRDLHFESFGLAFREEVIRRKNGNPVFYVETSNRDIRNAFDQITTNPIVASFKSMLPLVEGFGTPWFTRSGGPSEVDFRWEREWRVVGNFSFTLKEVAFGLCPADDIPFFEGLVNREFPFVDPLGCLDTAKQKLRNVPSLADLK